jgi:hypothetical protein
VKGLDAKDSAAIAALLRLALAELMDADAVSYCRRPSIAGAYVRALPGELIPALIAVVVDKVGDDGKRAATLTQLILGMRAAKGTYGSDEAIAQIVSEILALAQIELREGVRGKPAGWLGEARPHVLLALRRTLPEDLKQALRSPHDALGLIQSAYPGVYRILMSGTSPLPAVP